MIVVAIHRRSNPALSARSALLFAVSPRYRQTVETHKALHFAGLDAADTPIREALLSTIGDPYQAGVDSHGRPLAGRKQLRRALADLAVGDAVAVPALVVQPGVVYSHA